MNAKTTTDYMQENADLIKQVNAVTKQRDALLDVCRAFVVEQKTWQRQYQLMLLERLLDEMKDIKTIEVPE